MIAPRNLLLLVFVGVSAVFCHIPDGNSGLSEEDHFKMGSEHNKDFDHDAFLGRGHGHDFDKYSPEESKRKLRELIPKIDKDQNTKVSAEELRDWIEHQRTRYMWDNIDQAIRPMDKDQDKRITWKEYKSANYGDWDDESIMDEKLVLRIRKDQHKFNESDTDRDGKLTVEEFVYFRHPEESKHMKQIAVTEVIDEIDKDEDGLISMVEFLGQYGDGDDPPAWVVDDRKHFAERLDKDKNGVLNREEVYDWVVPLDEETDKEVRHLMEGADDDGDNILSTEEIVLHFDLFVGSTVTDHGKSLKDEF